MSLTRVFLSLLNTCLLKIYLLLPHVYVLPAFIFVHQTHAVSQRPEEGVRSPTIAFTNGCELPPWCWESKPKFHRKAASAYNC